MARQRNDKKTPKATYGLLRKLPCMLLGFFQKRRRWFGVTSHRLFVIKSEYLICYDKRVSQELYNTHMKRISEYAALADRKDIKRVVSLRNSTITKRPLHSFGFEMEVTIAPSEGREIHMLFPSTDAGDMWYAMLQGSRISVHYEDFEVIGELGQGAFGRVELVRYCKDNKLYALKTVEVEGEGSKLLSQFVEERTVMQKLQRCPFIVQLRMALREENFLHYVMEYCDRGDLFAYIRSKSRLAEEEVRRLGASLVCAVGFMHRQHVLHRDIKPENVLLTEALVAKLADFGLSKTLSSMKSRAFSFCGTDLYRPPEMSQQASGYNRSLDWWQVGCVIYEMAVGTPPFEGTKEERRQRVLKEEPHYPEWLSPELVGLLKGLLKKNPWERLGGGDGDVDEVKNMPFFSTVDWRELAAKAEASSSDVPQGIPSPVRPAEQKAKKRGQKGVDEDELLGFEYDEQVARELCTMLKDYTGMDSFEMA